MIPPFITVATKTRQLNLWEFTHLNTHVYGLSSLHSPSSWMHPHFICGNIDGLSQIKKGGSKTASFTYGDQISGNHISTIHYFYSLCGKNGQAPFSHRATLTLTTELLTFIPTSIPCRVTLPTPTELPSFLSSTIISICRALTSHSKQHQCWPILWPGLCLQSCPRQCIVR